MRIIVKEALPGKNLLYLSSNNLCGGKMCSMEFNPDGEPMSFLEKSIIVTFWFLTEIIGSVLLIGLIQFERFGGDPLKRRIVDQVLKFLYEIDEIKIWKDFKICSIFIVAVYNSVCFTTDS